MNNSNIKITLLFLFSLCIFPSCQKEGKRFNIDNTKWRFYEYAIFFNHVGRDDMYFNGKTKIVKYNSCDTVKYTFNYKTKEVFFDEYIISNRNGAFYSWYKYAFSGQVDKDRQYLRGKCKVYSQNYWLDTIEFPNSFPIFIEEYNWSAYRIK